MHFAIIYIPESEIRNTPGKASPVPAFPGSSMEQAKTVLISISLKKPVSVSHFQTSLAIKLLPCHQDEIVKIWISFYICISSFIRARICLSRSFTICYDNWKYFIQTS